MKTYLVGGAVRDHLLGIESRDRDYVVVGATPAEMELLGFKQVGAAFPVFLHPVTGEEYALARKEKKVAPGYAGFEVDFGEDVTLKDDLFRRDLTINSMAMTDDGELIDPFGGKADLEKGILRHTSSAFAEDPLRVLRLARFAARYGFSVDPDTIELSKMLVDEGELDALSADRVWAELVKMLGEKNPARGIRVLREVGCEKVKRLATLVSFTSYVSDQMDEKLTYPMKVYTYTNVSILRPEKLEELRVPTQLARQMRFYLKVHKLYDDSMLMELKPNEINVDLDVVGQVVDLFDTYREEVKAGELHQVARMLTCYTNDFTDVFGEIMQRAFDEYCKLDLETAVKAMPPKEIKKLVRELKVNTISFLFS